MRTQTQSVLLVWFFLILFLFTLFYSEVSWIVLGAAVAITLAVKLIQWVCQKRRRHDGD
jgi:hypothetical protein